MIVASIDWGFIWDHLPELLRGLRRTLEVSGIAIVGARNAKQAEGVMRAADHRLSEEEVAEIESETPIAA